MASDYLCMKSVELDGVLKKYLPIVTERLPDYEVFKKYDGCHAVVSILPSGHVTVQSRTGEENVACLPAARDAAFQLLEVAQAQGGLVLFAEAWKPGTEFRHISGAFRRQKEDEAMQLVVFDCVNLHEFEKGVSTRSYDHRMEDVDLLGFPQAGRAGLAESLGLVWELTEAHEPKTLQDVANDVVAKGGFDGIIVRDTDAGWTRGDGKHGASIKVKPLLSLDLRVVGQEQGKGKLANLMGKVFVEYRGVRIGVGTGFDNAERAENWIGRIIQVDSMGLTADGSLREPRFITERTDKTEQDT